ncbi:hypothetical protein H632_c2962p0 [Helicosporidium sp. ATCC 50920]|nr:hypothetical protein H632_c2962p0 [Helicosporidium sp. ATCC 50920]|eukprot:KDD72732.1 hypothetical protein H632_c2962p0 [Helicosporidium sp. ATCC 50920]
MPCSRFYAFSWFIMSMLFFIVVLTPLLLGLRGLSHFRVGIASLVAIQIMLLMDMANSFLYFNNIPTITGALLARGRVVIAGSITAAVALFTMLILLGIRNEHNPELLQSKTGEPAHSPDATRGGLYQPTENPEEQVRYYNPVSEGLQAPAVPRA